MEIRNQSRQTGKTIGLLKEMAVDENLYYIAWSAAAAGFAYREANALIEVMDLTKGKKIDRGRFLSVGQMDTIRRVTQGRPGVRFVVDELPTVLHTLLGAPVSIVTMSEDW